MEASGKRGVRKYLLRQKKLSDGLVRKLPVARPVASEERLAGDLLWSQGDVVFFGDGHSLVFGEVSAVFRLPHLPEGQGGPFGHLAEVFDKNLAVGFPVLALVGLSLEPFLDEGLVDGIVGIETARVAVQPVAALQSEYSLWTRQHEREIIPTIEELGIGLVAFSPLGKGFLAGKMDENTKFAEGDIRNVLPRYTEEARVANKAILDLLQKFAEQRGATTAQIAFAWVLAQKLWIVPIPGTTKLHRLTENIGAAAIELSAAELAGIEAASAQIEVVGTRYTEAMERSTGL